jgi:3-hydroxyisobutyrate dehydrogenase/2-hydroxy-3-oxopropionate reductase
MNVGFIGLGAMGAPMAWNLHDDGHLTAVYNRSRSRAEPFVEAGLPAAATPKALAEQVDVIVVMVTDDEALDDVLRGSDGVLAGLRSGATVVNTSTVSVEATRKADAALRRAGGRFVDAPVSGTVGPAEEGTLTVFAAGPDEAIRDVRPVFDAVGNRVIECGEAGEAAKTKLFVNLLLGNLVQGYAEALSFGAVQGLSLEHMQEAIKSSPVYTPLFDAKGEAVADRDFAKRFPVDLLLKDLDLALEAARDEGGYLPQTAATREAVSGARAQGHGDEDMIAVLKLLESVTGTEVGTDASTGATSDGDRAWTGPIQS